MVQRCFPLHSKKLLPLTSHQSEGGGEKRGGLKELINPSLLKEVFPVVRRTNMAQHMLSCFSFLCRGCLPFGLCGSSTRRSRSNAGAGEVCTFVFS